MAKRWDLIIRIDKLLKKPIFQQIAEEIIRHISYGRLKPGSVLPGTRTLADQLKLNRNTVTEAYSELASQGWIESKKGKGSFISHSLVTDSLVLKRQPPNSKGKLSSIATSKSALILDDGSPDSRLFPMQEFARAFGRVSRRLGNSVYTRVPSAKGSERLRIELAEMLNSRRALSVDEDRLLITRGSQHGIFLVGHVLGKESGAAVAVESPGYVPAWDAFQEAGLRIVEVPVDEEGIDVESLERSLKKGLKISALYVTPHHQFPTTVTLKADRRLKLLELSDRFNFWVIEDDYDHDFHFDSKPVLPLASMSARSKIIYISSLSKLVTPGVRLGYLSAPSEFLNQLIRIRTIIDRTGDPILEETIAELLVEGEIQRHANKMRSVYKFRRDEFAKRLLQKAPIHVEFQIPAGGMALWLKFPARITYDPFVTSMRNQGVVPIDRSLFHKMVSMPIHGTRIGFASLNDKEIELASSAVAKALK
tara:strand:+ start:1669 stop:3105 length:1437 start_codon:yes stop_codon:yes gene_type:complete